MAKSSKPATPKPPKDRPPSRAELVKQISDLHHRIDSDEIASRVATKRACQEAFKLGVGKARQQYNNLISRWGQLVSRADPADFAQAILATVRELEPPAYSQPSSVSWSSAPWTPTPTPPSPRGPTKDSSNV